MEVLLLVVFEADSVDASLIDGLACVTTNHIDLLIDIVILLKDVFAVTVRPWL